MINLGGADAGFVVEGIRWDSWGGRKAVGHGTAVVPGPGETLAQTRPSRVTVVASRLGTCAGQPAYLAVQWFDPAKGGRFDPKENLDTCPDTTRPFVQKPWAAGLDFGFVTAARIDTRGLVITFDRAQMLSGKAYRDHVAKHGTPENDYVILNTSTKTRTFRVPATATMYGNQLLGAQDGLRNEVISPKRLVQRVRQYGDRGVPVWLQHDKGTNGPVVYLAEQYLP